MSARLSQPQREALEAVAAGRVQYGSIYPAMDRRAAARGRSVLFHAFLIDGNEAYGAAKATLPSLEERSLIRVRREDVEMHAVPARTARRHSLAGPGEEYTLPAHEEPVDPGWRAAVELTDTGREALQ